MKSARKWIKKTACESWLLYLHETWMNLQNCFGIHGLKMTNIGIDGKIKLYWHWQPNYIKSCTCTTSNLCPQNAAVL